MKDNIIDGDILWTAESSPGFLVDGIRLDNSSGKYEGFSFESSAGATLGPVDNRVLGVAYSLKLWK